MPWVTGDHAWTVAGVFAGLSLVLSTHHIYKHLKHYYCPAEQKWIVRILFMVPIYALASWLSLRFFHLSIYFDTIRNIYEAFVIYNFLALCFEYLGGEAAIVAAIRGRVHTPSLWSCSCCFGEFAYSPLFLRLCKQGTLQFCVVKPFMATLIIIMVSTGTYEEGDLRPDRGYLYTTIVYNISIGLALLALAMFYQATHDLLGPHQPLLKFAIVKSVIFVSFWQGVAIAILEKVGMIHSTDDGDIASGELAVAYQNFLICIEMFFASILHLYAFPWRPYVGENRGRQTTSVSRNLKATLNPSDMIDDTIRNFSKSYVHYVRPRDDPDDPDDENEGYINVHPLTMSGQSRSKLLEADTD